MLCSNDEDDERIYAYFLNKKKLIVTSRSIEEKENNKINWLKLWKKYSSCICVISQSGA